MLVAASRGRRKNPATAARIRTGKTEQENISPAMGVAVSRHREWQTRRHPDAARRHVVGPGENERDRKPGQQEQTVRRSVQLGNSQAGNTAEASWMTPPAAMA